jgi:hypothetical protein
MSTGWIQFLLVVVPVLSLIGSWLALRTMADWQARKGNQVSHTGWSSHE